MLCPSRTIREVGVYRRRIREYVRRELESSSITELWGLPPGSRGGRPPAPAL
jgi:hypothetical protein